MSQNNIVSDPVSDPICDPVTDPVSDPVSESVSDSISSSDQINLTSLGQYTHVKFKCPDTLDRVPADIIICIDISGSMDGHVTIKNEEGIMCDDGLSRLDLVKHAALALINGQTSLDRVGITVFSTHVSELMPLTLMTDDAKEVAEKKIKSLQPGGSTNLWAAIESSLDMLRLHNMGEHKTKCVCLLTDGEPSTELTPSGGFVNALNKYKDSNIGFNCILNMVGFGYSLKSDLLESLSQQMNGSYCFVPDGLMIATAFAHIGANIATTFGTNAVMKINFKNQADLQATLNNRIINIGSCYKWSKNSMTLFIELVNLCHGQDRSVVIQTPSQGIESIEVVFTDTLTNTTKTVFQDFDNYKLSDTLDKVEIASLTAQVYRQLLVQTVRECMKIKGFGNSVEVSILLTDAYKVMQSFEKDIFADGSELTDIIKDLTGEITTAFNSDTDYNKWGKHYIPSLARAHIIQQCNNFKDPGIQHFGGKKFKEIRDTMHQLFNTMPDPVPSHSIDSCRDYIATYNKTYGGTNSGINPRTQNIGKSSIGSFIGSSMASRYNNADGGCFHGSGMVSMADGSVKAVDQIKSGDMVKAYTGKRPIGTPDCTDSAYEVLTVIRTKTKNGRAEFVNYNGLILTLTHPVIGANSLSDPEWCSPINIMDGHGYSESCEYVYNFILKSGHIITINNIQAVTLGHGFIGNQYIEHDFFGTNRVIDQIQSPKFITKTVNGVITFEADCLIRHPFNLWVTGYDFEKIIC
jgi:Mg-chelatase subunit ChlD